MQFFKLSLPLIRNNVECGRYERLYSSYEEALAQVRRLIEEDFQIDWQPSVIIVPVEERLLQ